MKPYLEKIQYEIQGIRDDMKKTLQKKMPESRPKVYPWVALFLGIFTLILAFYIGFILVKKYIIAHDDEALDGFVPDAGDVYCTDEDIDDSVEIL